MASNRFEELDRQPNRFEELESKLNRGAGTITKDLAKGIAAGVLDFPKILAKGPILAADLASTAGQYLGSKVTGAPMDPAALPSATLDKVIGTAGRAADALSIPQGLRPAQWADRLRESQSAYTKAETAGIGAESERYGKMTEQLTKGVPLIEGTPSRMFGEVAGVIAGAAKHPVGALNLVAENAANLAAIPVIVKKAVAGLGAKATPSLVANISHTVEGLIAGGAVIGEVEERVIQDQVKENLAREARGEAPLEITPATVLQRSAGIPAAVLTAAIAKFSPFGDAEAQLATKMVGLTAPKQVATSRVGAAARGVVSEGLIQEPLQEGQENIWSNLATGRPWHEGVGTAAGMGALIGAPAGGAMGAIAHKAQLPTSQKVKAIDAVRKANLSNAELITLLATPNIIETVGITEGDIKSLMKNRQEDRVLIENFNAALDSAPSDVARAAMLETIRGSVFKKLIAAEQERGETLATRQQRAADAKALGIGTKETEELVKKPAIPHKEAIDIAKTRIAELDAKESMTQQEASEFKALTKAGDDPKQLAKVLKTPIKDVQINRDKPKQEADTSTKAEKEVKPGQDVQTEYFEAQRVGLTEQIAKARAVGDTETTRALQITLARLNVQEAKGATAPAAETQAAPAAETQAAPAAETQAAPAAETQAPAAQAPAAQAPAAQAPAAQAPAAQAPAALLGQASTLRTEANKAFAAGNNDLGIALTQRAIDLKNQAATIQKQVDEAPKRLARGDEVTPAATAAPALVSRVISGSHKSSNMQSLNNGFEQRPLGISIARTSEEELSSPTVKDAQGEKGTVGVEVAGKGLDYNIPEHRDYIEKLFEEATTQKEKPYDIYVLDKLRVAGVDFVDNFNGIGKGKELHVLNAKAITIKPALVKNNVGQAKKHAVVREKARQQIAKAPATKKPLKLSIGMAKNYSLVKQRATQQIENVRQRTDLSEADKAYLSAVEAALGDPQALAKALRTEIIDDSVTINVGQAKKHGVIREKARQQIAKHRRRKDLSTADKKYLDSVEKALDDPKALAKTLKREVIAEPKKVEPKKVEPEPEKPEPKKVEPEPEKPEPKKVEPKKPEARVKKPKKVEPKKPEARVKKPKKVEPKKPEARVKKPEKPEARIKKLVAQLAKTQAARAAAFQANNEVEGNRLVTQENALKAEIKQAKTDQMANFKFSQGASQSDEGPRHTMQSLEAELISLFGKGIKAKIKSGRLILLKGTVNRFKGSPIYDKRGRLLGSYNKDTGEITLYAGNILLTETEGLMVHEVGHLLLAEDKLFQEKKAQLVNEFESLREPKNIVDQYFIQVEEDKSVQPEDRSEEALMRFTGDSVNARNQESWSEKLKAFWSRLVSAVKAALFRANLSSTKLSKEDMVAVFSQATRAFIRQQQTQEASQVNETQDHKTLTHVIGDLISIGLMQGPSKEMAKSNNVSPNGAIVLAQLKKNTSLTPNEKTSINSFVGALGPHMELFKETDINVLLRSNLDNKIWKPFFDNIAKYVVVFDPASIRSHDLQGHNPQIVADRITALRSKALQNVINYFMSPGNQFLYRGIHAATIVGELLRRNHSFDADLGKAIYSSITPSSRVPESLFNGAIAAAAADQLQQGEGIRKAYQNAINEVYGTNDNSAIYEAVGVPTTGWHIFKQGSNPGDLKDISATAPGKWCTGHGAAETYLSRGSMHVYSENGVALISINVSRGTVTEVSGSLDGQWLTEREAALAQEYAGEQQLDGAAMKNVIIDNNNMRAVKRWLSDGATVSPTFDIDFIGGNFNIKKQNTRYYAGANEEYLLHGKSAEQFSTAILKLETPLRIGDAKFNSPDDFRKLEAANVIHIETPSIMSIPSDNFTLQSLASLTWDNKTLTSLGSVSRLSEYGPKFPHVDTVGTLYLPWLPLVPNVKHILQTLNVNKSATLNLESIGTLDIAAPVATTLTVSLPVLTKVDTVLIKSRVTRRKDVPLSTTKVLAPKLTSIDTLQISNTNAELNSGVTHTDSIESSVGGRLTVEGPLETTNYITAINKSDISLPPSFKYYGYAIISESSKVSVGAEVYTNLTDLLNVKKEFIDNYLKLRLRTISSLLFDVNSKLHDYLAAAAFPDSWNSLVDYVDDLQYVETPITLKQLSSLSDQLGIARSELIVALEGIELPELRQINKTFAEMKKITRSELAVPKGSQAHENLVLKKAAKRTDIKPWSRPTKEEFKAMTKEEQATARILNRVFSNQKESVEDSIGKATKEAADELAGNKKLTKDEQKFAKLTSRLAGEYVRPPEGQEAAPWDRWLSSPEFYFQKTKASWKVFQAALKDGDIRFRAQHKILGSFQDTAKDILKRSPETYEAVGDYLVNTDQTGIGWGLKLNAEGKWVVLNRKNEEVFTTATEEKAIAFAMKAEQDWLWGRGKSKDFLRMVLEARQLTNRAFNVLAADMRQQVARNKANGIPEPTHMYIDDTGKSQTVAISDLMALMGDLRMTYFPRERIAKDFRLIAEKDGETSILETYDWHLIPNSMGNNTAEVMKQTFNKLAPAGRRRAELEAAGWKVRIKKVSAPADMLFDMPGMLANLDTVLSEATTMVEADASEADFAAVDRKYLMTVDKLLALRVADIYKAKGTFSSRMKRSEELFTGYETDPIRALVGYTSRLATGVAKRETARKMLAAITGRVMTWPEYKKQNPKATYTNYLGMIRTERLSPTHQSRMYEDVRTYMKFFLKPDDTMGIITGYLKAVAVFKYLGFRVASAAINLTNLIVSVPGTLAAHSGTSVPKAYKAIGRALVILGKFQRNSLIARGHTWLGTPTKISPKQERLIKLIYMNGWAEAQFNHDAAEAMTGAIGTINNKGMAAAMYMFGLTEQVNRAATILAAYNLMDQASSGKIDLKILEHRAKHASDRAHGVYGKGAKPYIVQTTRPVDLLYTFQKFQHTLVLNTIELTTKYKKPWMSAYITLAPQILAGTSAFTAVGFALAKLFDVDDPEEEYVAFIASLFGGGEIAQTFARDGLIGAAIGANFKGSLALTSPIPTSITEIGGAPGSVLVDLYEGAGHLSQGESMKAAEKVLPNAFGSGFKGYREYTEGLTTKTYAPIFHEGEPVKAAELDFALRLFSFNPSRISTIRNVAWKEDEIRRQYTKLRDEIMSKYRRLYVQKAPEGDPAWADVLAEVIDYNKRVAMADPRFQVPFIDSKYISTQLKTSFTPDKYSR